MKTVAGFCALVELLFACGMAFAEPATTRSPYTLTVVPFYSPEKIWARYAPMIDYLRQDTGQPWELVFYPSHDTLIEGLCSGEVALAFLGPVPLGRAMERCGVEVVLIARAPDGDPFYHAVLLTAEPEVATLADLRDRPVALFRGSTASHILPRTMLREVGIGRDGIRPVFFESQDRIMTALLNREVAGAGVKEALYQKFAGEGLRVLAVSEPLPNFAFAARPGLDPGVRASFADSLLRLQPQGNPQDRQRLDVWDDEVRNGFLPVPPSFHDSVRALAAVSSEILREDR
ncbi:MAG: PhnD/SsuA/transferrin family substrate-binding protein [Thermodesulfobacteriota bacterium]